MRNEYGVKLDKNGYAPSIMHIFADDACFNCEAIGDLCRHEIFNGSERERSKAYGLWVNLCPRCHMDIHNDAELRRQLKVTGEMCALNWYDWTIEDFRERFGKNYVEE